MEANVPSGDNILIENSGSLYQGAISTFRDSAFFSSASTKYRGLEKICSTTHPIVLRRRRRKVKPVSDNGSV